MRRVGNIDIDAVRGGHGSGAACGSHQNGDFECTKAYSYSYSITYWEFLSGPLRFFLAPPPQFKDKIIPKP